MIAQSGASQKQSQHLSFPGMLVRIPMTRCTSFAFCCTPVILYVLAISSPSSMSSRQSAVLVSWTMLAIQSSFSSADSVASRSTFVFFGWTMMTSNGNSDLTPSSTGGRSFPDGSGCRTEHVARLYTTKFSPFV